MNSSISRRQFVAAAAGATAACLLPWTLTGCASEGNENGGAGENGSANNESASSSALEATPFDRTSFTVGDALGETYEQALAKVQEIAPDAVLFALRFSHAIGSGQAANWDYMFASQKELRYYIAFTGSVVSVSELGKCTMKFSEWENVPAVDTIQIDAAAAYESVCEAAADMAQPSDLYAYLILYSEQADTASTEYAYEDEPLNWYFEFTFDGEGAAEEETRPSDGDSDGDSGDDAASSDAPASAEEAEAPLTAYSVNATTGETLCVAEAEG